mgnify:CR=1 FL=1
MIGFGQEWAFARSFLLGSSLPRFRPRITTPQPMTSAGANADQRFARETGPARTIADLAEPVLKHRMALTFAARAEGVDMSHMVARLVEPLG